jgi:hypothetical protein
MALSIDNEANQVAKYLAARGITAFVLRYRLAATEGDATEDHLRLLQNDRPRFDQMVAKAGPLAVADGLAIWRMSASTQQSTVCRLTELASWASRRAAV